MGGVTPRTLRCTQRASSQAALDTCATPPCLTATEALAPHTQRYLLGRGSSSPLRVPLPLSESATPPHFPTPVTPTPAPPITPTPTNLSLPHQPHLPLPYTIVISYKNAFIHTRRQQCVQVFNEANDIVSCGRVFVLRHDHFPLAVPGSMRSATSTPLKQ